MVELDRDDAVIAGLAALGEPEPILEDDLARAELTLRSFRDARRRRAWGTRAMIGVASAIAATLVIGFLVPIERSPALAIEVTSGAFELQASQLAAGDTVPTDEWMEVADARACVRVQLQEACVEPGGRVRVRSDGRLELERGRVRVEPGLAVSTEYGELASDAELELELVPESATITVHEGAATLSDARGQSVLEPGTHALADRDAPELARVARAPVHAPTGAVAVPEEDEPVITGGDSPPAVEVVAPRKATVRSNEPAKPTAGAGEMLAAARALVSTGKLEPAARAYQKLIATHPSSSEARAALVSLGRVQASRGKSSAALAAFEAYLDRGGGALSEEAHWGRISALHALGRTAERDRAIAALAAKHPRSVYLAKARKLAGG